MVGRNNLLKPYYDIQLVRSLAASGSAKFLMRTDGKADPANVGMDTKTALDIIASLSPNIGEPLKRRSLHQAISHKRRTASGHHQLSSIDGEQYERRML